MSCLLLAGILCHGLRLDVNDRVLLIDADVRDAQARVDQFLSGQMAVAPLSVRDDAW